MIYTLHPVFQVSPMLHLGLEEEKKGVGGGGGGSIIVHNCANGSWKAEEKNVNIDRLLGEREAGGVRVGRRSKQKNIVISVTEPRQNNSLANLRLPGSLEALLPRPALVCTHPGRAQQSLNRQVTLSFK